MKKILLQIVYDMRTQPVIAWVTVVGTALSVFLIMTLMMMQHVRTVSIRPETARDRMLYGMYFHTNSFDGQWSNSASLSYETARRLYDGLEGVERASYLYTLVSRLDVKGSNGAKLTADVLHTDDEFWRVYDHRLIDGRYYTADEVAAGRNLAVVTESMARRLFGAESPVGSRFEVDHNIFEVVGVVADVSRLASKAYAEVYVPVDYSVTWSDLFGPFQVALLTREGTDPEMVRDQVRKRYAEIDAELRPTGVTAVYHESPYDQETIATGNSGSNITPDASGPRMLRMLAYAVLLLIPAINLSTMLHSRLRRRVNEIGIRRAYGCTRRRIIAEIIAENMVVTLAGGVIGLGAGLVFALCYDGLYTSSTGDAARPAVGMLLDWSVMAATFSACFILNIISASVPAWQASRLNPVEAINAK